MAAEFLSLAEKILVIIHKPELNEVNAFVHLHTCTCNNSQSHCTNLDAVIRTSTDQNELQNYKMNS